MNPLVTGRSRLSALEAPAVLARLKPLLRVQRLIHGIEKVMVAGAALALEDAGIALPFKPAGAEHIGIYVGMDDSIEALKDEFFAGILADGPLGASPLLFPFTSPNAFAAQTTIALDLRGESLTFPIKNTYNGVIQYAIRSVQDGFSPIALAGAVCLEDYPEAAGDRQLVADFVLIEGAGRSRRQGR